ncbi:hypothetical protein [Bdellovibrio bacteriovorus]|uniref:hypothetical protein n=1 Tax=Bdellovibrio TaxID=958 RepID=UPI0035A8C123
MMKFFFAWMICLSSLVVASPVMAAPAVTQVYVNGVVEHVEAMENEAMVKLAGVQQLLIIKNLMGFPENKIEALMNSRDQQVTIKLKVNNKNQIVDVIL